LPSNASREASRCARSSRCSEAKLQVQHPPLQHSGVKGAGDLVHIDPNAAHLFFQLVSRRYERGSLLITSNRSVGEWGDVFGDAVVATAILDRLLHHSHVLTIRGDSYRLREKRRAGLVITPQPVNPEAVA